MSVAMTAVTIGALKASAPMINRWYQARDEAGKVIVRHSCIGGGIALIPIPVVGELAVIANQVWMYRELNKLTGISFSENVLKCIGKFIVSQVAGILGGTFALFGVAAAIKFVPGLNFLAGIAAAPIAGVANYVCGEVYYRMLGGYIKKIAESGDEGLTDDDIIMCLKDEMVSADEIDKIRESAKEKLADAKYSDYKKTAEDLVDAQGGE